MRTLCFTGLGFLYGAVLALLGLGVSAGGHGFTVPLVVFSSPLFFPLLIFAPIVIWTVVGLLLSQTDNVVCMRALVGVMLLHYVGMVPYLYYLGDWEYGYKVWDRSPAAVLIPFEVYFAGQVGIWFSYFQHWRKRGNRFVTET